MSQVAVRLNGQELSLPAGATVARAIEVVGCGTRGVAVAVNSELVPRAQWAGRALMEGDELEVLHAVAGG